MTVTAQPIVSAERESALLSGPDQLRSLIEQGTSAATIIDGDPGQLEQRFAALGVDKLSFAPDIVIAPSSVLSERFIERSGAVARIGALQGPAEVQPNSQTSISYVQTVPAVFPGEQPSLDGLRGYLAGLALAEGVKGGTSAAKISSRLVEVPPFADALLTPWRADATAAGSQLFNILRGTFLPGTLIPQSAGGESFNGIYFPDGSWTGVTTKPLGPSFRQPVPPIR